MDTVQECDDLHKIRQRLKEVVILFVRQVALDVEVADEDQTGKGQDFLLSPAELCVLHVSLHDADERRLPD